MAKDNVYDKIVAEYDKYNGEYKFIGYYSTYATSLIGDNIVDAIKDFNNHYNATLSMVMEFDLEKGEPIKLFRSKTNKVANARGQNTCSYYEHGTDKLVYNEDDDMRPIVIIKPSKITHETEHGYIDRSGNFYKCGFENHISLANELFLSKTIPEKKEDEHRYSDTALDERGWVKISSKRIHYLEYLQDKTKIKLTNAQKKTIIKFMDITGFVNYEFNRYIQSKEEIIIELYEE